MIKQFLIFSVLCLLSGCTSVFHSIPEAVPLSEQGILEGVPIHVMIENINYSQKELLEYAEEFRNKGESKVIESSNRYKAGFVIASYAIYRLSEYGADIVKEPNNSTYTLKIHNNFNCRKEFGAAQFLQMPLMFITLFIYPLIQNQDCTVNAVTFDPQGNVTGTVNSIESNTVVWSFYSIFTEDNYGENDDPIAIRAAWINSVKNSIDELIHEEYAFD